MKEITVEIHHTDMASQDLLDRYIQQLIPDIESIATADYYSEYAFIKLPYDTEMIKAINEAAWEKQKLEPTLLLLIGIGGSNLGARTAQEFILGTFYNETNPSLKIYYVDSINPTDIDQIYRLTESHLQSGNNIIINVVSKSGKTTETIAAFELFLALLQKYHPHDYPHYIVATTDHNSLLWQLAHKESWSILEITAQVGGRFSVFSAAALFPLAMLNIDIDELIKGAQQSTTLCLKKDHTNLAALSAAWQYNLCKEGYHISNLFMFSDSLQSLGKWWRQLTAESLGKEIKRDGVPNKDALLPIISVGPADLHSIGQLYFANIISIMTTFVICQDASIDYTLPSYHDQFDSIVPHIQNKNASSIMHAIIQGVTKAYKIKDLPYRTIIIPEKNAYYCGHLLQQLMFEVLYLAKLLNVNPFDQPAVELYKQKTRKILANE